MNVDGGRKRFSTVRTELSERSHDGTGRTSPGTPESAAAQGDVRNSPHQAIRKRWQPAYHGGIGPARSGATETDSHAEPATPGAEQENKVLSELDTTVTRERTRERQTAVAPSPGLTEPPEPRSAPLESLHGEFATQPAAAPATAAEPAAGHAAPQAVEHPAAGERSAVDAQPQVDLFAEHDLRTEHDLFTEQDFAEQDLAEEQDFVAEQDAVAEQAPTAEHTHVAEQGLPAEQAGGGGQAAEGEPNPWAAPADDTLAQTSDQAPETEWQEPTQERQASESVWQEPAGRPAVRPKPTPFPRQRPTPFPRQQQASPETFPQQQAGTETFAQREAGPEAFQREAGPEAFPRQQAGPEAEAQTCQTSLPRSPFRLSPSTSFGVPLRHWPSMHQEPKDSLFTHVDPRPTLEFPTVEPAAKSRKRLKASKGLKGNPVVSRASGLVRALRPQLTALGRLAHRLWVAALARLAGLARSLRGVKLPALGTPWPRRRLSAGMIAAMLGAVVLLGGMSLGLIALNAQQTPALAEGYASSVPAPPKHVARPANPPHVGVPAFASPDPAAGSPSVDSPAVGLPAPATSPAPEASRPEANAPRSAASGTGSSAHGSSATPSHQASAAAAPLRPAQSSRERARHSTSSQGSRSGKATDSGAQSGRTEHTDNQRSSHDSNHEDDDGVARTTSDRGADPGLLGGLLGGNLLGIG